MLIVQPDKNAGLLEYYDAFIKLCSQSFDGVELEKIKSAFQKADDLSRIKTRASGEPYLLHPLRVAYVALNDIKMGASSIITALLHDVVEDELITIEAVEKQFSKEVSGILQGLICTFYYISC